MKALVVLLVALGLCAGLLYAAPPAAEAVVAALPAVAQHDARATETVFTLVFFGSLLACGLIGAAICGTNALRAGRKPARYLLVGGFLGAVGVAAASGYAWLAGSLARGPAEGSIAALAWGSALVFLEASAEEVYFRGWLQRVLAERWGPRGGIVAAALAFAGLHILGGTRNPISVVNLFLGGLLFGLLMARSGGLVGAVAAHFSWNWTEGIVLGLSPNPGVGSFGAWINLELTGPTLWGGSEEGLNGSLAMLLTLAALLIPLALLRAGADAKAARSARDRPAPART